MTVSISLYNHTAKLLGGGDVDLSGLKLMLTSGYTFDATQVNMTAASAAQVSGNGWAAGGVAVANVSVTTVTTNDAKLDADDVSATASGGSIGPADGAVLYDATNTKPLAYIDFGGAQAAGVGTDFKVNWNASGIVTFTVA